jgi:HlyD family secretion protein
LAWYLLYIDNMGMDRVVTKKKFHPGWILSIILVLGLAAVFSYQLMVVDKKGAQSVKKASIEISTVQKGEFQEYFLVNCYAAPSRSIYIDARESGVVKSVFTEQGNIVFKGLVMLELQNDDLESELALKQASVESAQKELDNNPLRLSQLQLGQRQKLLETDHQIDILRVEYDKKTLLFKAGGVSEKDLQTAKRELDFWTESKKLLLEAQDLALELTRQDGEKIRNSISVLKIDLQRIRTRIANLRIQSPAFGQVTAFDASVGEMKPAGSRIAQLDIMENLKLKATLDEYYLPQIKVGNKGSFSFQRAEGEVVPCEVAISWISPDVKNNSIEVDFGFTGIQPYLRIGQRFVVRVEQGNKQDALLLNQGAFFQSSGGSWVYAIDAAGTAAERRDIKIGKSNPEFLEVLEGLAPGEKVITSDYSGFGDAVKISLQ